MHNKLSGKEIFTFHNQNTGLNILEYWQWLYSDIYDLQDSLAEYIVAKALENVADIDQQPKLEGRFMTMILIPKK